MTHSQKKHKSIETISECPQKLDLAGKDFKAAMINKFKELK